MFGLDFQIVNLIRQPYFNRLMIEYIYLILGLALLYNGAGYLVEGSSSLAKKLGISALVIGLTVVAFGTSMPELIVNVFASLKGNAEVSYGNIIGSNIFNILLILGLASVIKPLAVQRSTVWKEIPFALLAALVLFAMSNKLLLGGAANNLTIADGLIMLFFFVIFLYYVFELAKDKPKESNMEIEVKKHSSTAIFLMIIGGLAALFIGGKLTVAGAVAIARQIGISELLISSTIIAAGTSLPELVTSVVAAIKKEMDLSVGNVVGSNIFNIFLIMGVSSLISPLAVPAGINFDFIFLTATTLLLFIFMFIGKKHELDRWEGAMFLLMYVAYVAFIIRRG